MPPASSPVTVGEAVSPGYRWLCSSCRTFNPAGEAACAGCGGGWALPAAATRERRGMRGLPALLEIGLLAALFLLWRAVGALSGGSRAAALARGRALWALERRVHLPSEAAVQQLVLGHPDLVRTLNIYYLAAHVAGMAGFLVWLYLRHPDAYPRWRWLVAAYTGVCLLAAFLPVAPPRMLGGTGLVDTAARYHESAYGPVAGRLTDALSSMPSVHFGWALLIAVAALTVSRSRWRFLVLAHPALTLFVITATANHYWLDSLAAAALLAGVLVGARPATVTAIKLRRSSNRG